MAAQGTAFLNEQLSVYMEQIARHEPDSSSPSLSSFLQPSTLAPMHSSPQHYPAQPLSNPPPLPTHGLAHSGASHHSLCASPQYHQRVGQLS